MVRSLDEPDGGFIGNQRRDGVPLLFSRIDGLVGRVDAPDIGVLIGEFASATLTRRGDVNENPQDPEASFVDLHAVVRFINKALLDDDDYEKVVTVWQKKNPRRKWKLEPRPKPGQDPAVRTARLQGKSYTMERVELCPVEERS